MSLQITQFHMQVGRDAFVPFHAETVCLKEDNGTIMHHWIKPEHLKPGVKLRIETITENIKDKIREMCIKAIKDKLPVTIFYYANNKPSVVAQDIHIDAVDAFRGIDHMAGTFSVHMTIARDKAKFQEALNAAKELSKEHDRQIYKETVEALADLMAPGLIAHPNIIDNLKKWPTYTKTREPFSYRGGK